MTTDEEIAALLLEHKGVNVGDITILPLSMEDALDPQVAEDLAKIGQQLYASLEKLAGAKAEELDTLIAALTPVLPRVKRLLARCIDRPLAGIPLALAPVVLRRFVALNFSGPRLKPWADLLLEVGSVPKGRAAPSTSETPPSSSSTTDTPTGGATPEASSSSGSGARSAASGDASPTT